MINNLKIENIQMLIFSGDIHGEVETIVYKLNQFTDTVLIVCGDIGMGFHKDEYYFNLFKKLNLKLSKKNNHLILFRGNHDNPDYFNGSFKKYKHIHLISDYTVVSVEQTHILCIGGGTSVDRTERISLEKQKGRKLYWGDAELPYFDNDKLDEINNLYQIQIVATHTCPSFAYPTTKTGISGWLKIDATLSQTLDEERATMDKIFAKLQESQNRITDWYYGHYHEHKIEQHHGINFRLCDCGELNEYIRFRKLINN